MDIIKTILVWIAKAVWSILSLLFKGISALVALIFTYIFDSSDNARKNTTRTPRTTRSVADGVKYSADGKSLLKAPAGCTSCNVRKGTVAICDKAFSECGSLTTITLPDGLTTIGNRVFELCDSLTAITIPASLTTIGEGAFFGCESLPIIMLPEGLTTIGELSFCNCISLPTITLPDSLTTIGENAFEGSDVKEIIVPEGCRARFAAMVGEDYAQYIKEQPSEAEFQYDVKSKTTISVTGNKKIVTLQKEFNQKFQYLSLCLFDDSAKELVEKGESIAQFSGDLTLASVRTVNAGGEISIYGNKKIKTLEKEFNKVFGLFCQVCYTDSEGHGYYTSGSNDEMTLSSFDEKCKNNGCKKGVWR